MSLIDRFSRKTLCIGLAPDQLTCVIRSGKSFVREGAYQQHFHHTDGQWQPVLNSLRGYLQQSKFGRRKPPVAAVLSGRWSRMMMVPWSDALLKESSAADFLQAQFVALYGSEARDWVIACDDAPYGQPRLACGIERGLLETFRQLMGEHRHTCQFVEPVISAAWRKITQNLGNQVKAFALIEVGMIVLASVNRGRIVAVQTQPCGKSWQDELMKAWQRWTLRLPELAETAEVVVLNLTSEIMNGELPPPFKHVTISLSGLEPAYTFAACSRSR